MVSSHLRESLVFLKRLLSATLGIYGTERKEVPETELCLEETTVSRWCQRHYGRNTYVGYECQDREAKMRTSSSQQ